ncbi:MAG: hypothetical protein ACYCX3_07320 [Thermoleophilia bacterium]
MTTTGSTMTPGTPPSADPQRKVLFGIGIIVIGAILLVAALALAAVLIFAPWSSNSEGTVGGADPGAPVVMGVGPGISVRDALASTLDEPLLVNGLYYVTADGVVYFTDTMAESYPPQIDVTRSLKVDGIDPGELVGLERSGGIAWSNAPTQLTGRVAGGIITVSGTVQP